MKQLIVNVIIKKMMSSIIKITISIVNTFLRRFNLQLSSLNRPEECFSTNYYRDQACRKMEHLSTLNLDLRNKSVLDLGAGPGDYTQYYLNRNCQVTALDSNIQNIHFMRRRFMGNSKVTFKHQSLSPHSDVFRNQYDIVHFYGLFYILKDQEIIIEKIKNCCVGLLIIESRVTKSASTVLYKILNKNSADGSLDGNMYIPSRIELFNLLKKHFKYVYMPLTQPNWRECPIHWEQATVEKQDTFRVIFIASSKKINNPLLSEKLLPTQYYCS